jgi:xylulose-5-phosphate/fructose-6-phosphate phosphoketolase
LARITPEELEDLFKGYGWTPHFVEGDDPEIMHATMAKTVDACIEQIRSIQKEARNTNNPKRPRWPMIVLRTPKGWTCPKQVDGHRVEGSW